MPRAPRRVSAAGGAQVGARLRSTKAHRWRGEDHLSRRAPRVRRSAAAPPSASASASASLPGVSVVARRAPGSLSSATHSSEPDRSVNMLLLGARRALLAHDNRARAECGAVARWSLAASSACRTSTRLIKQALLEVQERSKAAVQAAGQQQQARHRAERRAPAARAQRRAAARRAQGAQEGVPRGGPTAQHGQGREGVVFPSAHLVPRAPGARL